MPDTLSDLESAGQKRVTDLFSQDGYFYLLKW